MTAFERQLKILRTWINIRTSSFLGKYHELEMGKSAWETISCTKNLSLFCKEHFTYCYILRFFSNNPGFEIQPNVVRIITVRIYYSSFTFF